MCRRFKSVPSHPKTAFLTSGGPFSLSPERSEQPRNCTGMQGAEQSCIEDVKRRRRSGLSTRLRCGVTGPFTGPQGRYVLVAEPGPS